MSTLKQIPVVIEAAAGREEPLNPCFLFWRRAIADLHDAQPVAFVGQDFVRGVFTDRLRLGNREGEQRALRARGGADGRFSDFFQCGRRTGRKPLRVQLAARREEDVDADQRRREATVFGAGNAEFECLGRSMAKDIARAREAFDGDDLDFDCDHGRGRRDAWQRENAETQDSAQNGKTGGCSAHQFSSPTN